jgi:hypothetical protein
VLESLIGELEPLPLSYFEEPAPRVELAAPGAYLQLSGAYAEEARLARGYGWPATRLPLHHLAMLTHPTAVAAAVSGLAAELAQAADV